MIDAARSASAGVVFHDDTLMRIAVAPSHWVGPHQMRPSRCTSASRRSVVGPSTEPHEHLVEHDVVEDLDTAGAEPIGDVCGAVARLLHEPCDALATERTEHRPHLDLARSLARLRRVVHRLEPGLRWQVAGGRCEGTSQRARPLHERDAAVVGDVEPLVAVGGEGVGACRGRRRAGRVVGSANAHRPKAPSTCSQPPRAATQSAIGSNGSNAPVFTSPAWAQHRIGPSAGSRSGSAARDDPTLVVRRHDDRRGRAPGPRGPVTCATCCAPSRRSPPAAPGRRTARRPARPSRARSAARHVPRRGRWRSRPWRR